jgi:hypothetical protein
MPPESAGSDKRIVRPGGVSERKKEGEGRGEGGLLIGTIGEQFDGWNRWEIKGEEIHCAEEIPCVIDAGKKTMTWPCHLGPPVCEKERGERVPIRCKREVGHVSF